MHVIGVEYPGYGPMKGKPSEKNLNNAVSKVFKYVTQTLGWPEQQIIVLGRSIGSGPALQLATNADLGGIVLVSAFKSIKEVAKDRFPKLVRVLPVTKSWNNIECIKLVKCPVLLVHGALDRIVLPSHSLALLKAITHAQKGLSTLEQRGHNKLNWSPIIREMGAFMLKFIISDGLSPNPLNIEDPCFQRARELIRRFQDLQDNKKSCRQKITKPCQSPVASKRKEKGWKKKTTHMPTPASALPDKKSVEKKGVPTGGVDKVQDRQEEKSADFPQFG